MTHPQLPRTHWSKKCNNSARLQCHDPSFCWRCLRKVLEYCSYYCFSNNCWSHRRLNLATSCQQHFSKSSDGKHGAQRGQRRLIAFWRWFREAYEHISVCCQQVLQARPCCKLQASLVGLKVNCSVNLWDLNLFSPSLYGHLPNQVCFFRNLTSVLEESSKIAG